MPPFGNSPHETGPDNEEDLDESESKSPKAGTGAETGANSRRQKRQVSDQRRAQNRRAQRNYRTKQRRHLQMLENLVVSQTLGLPPTTMHDDTASAPISQGSYGGPSLHLEMEGTPDHDAGRYSFAESPPNMGKQPLELSFQLQSLCNPPTQFPLDLQPNAQSQYLWPDAGPGVPWNPGLASLAQMNQVNYGINSPYPEADSSVWRSSTELERRSDLSAPVSQDESAEPASSIARLLLLESGSYDERLCEEVLKKGLTLQDIILAGVHALSGNAPAGDTSLSIAAAQHESGKGDCKRSSNTARTLDRRNIDAAESRRLPDLHTNTIRMVQLTFVAASMANAALLGLPEGLIHDYGAESVFYETFLPKSSTENPTSEEYSHLKEALRPGVTQLTHSHHPYLDVLPFPTFRSRAITLVFSDPPLLDRNDLCHDLVNGGLVCWGSSMGGGGETRGSGAPWDMRSWEARPWFLKKWWMLVGSVESEMYQQSRWWCEMRGESSLFHDE